MATRKAYSGDQSHHSGAIRLLEKKDNNSLQINEKALDFIKNLQGPVCSCVIMGQYRTGKSFLLNRLFGLDSISFKVGHTDQPETKDIWLSREKIKIPCKALKQEMNVLLIDTEGLESFDSDDKWDTNLFLASLLLSSVLIYNTKNTLAKDAFNKLSVATCISEKVKFNSKLSSAMNETKLKQQGPDLFWIVRDFYLRTTKPAQEEFEAILDYETKDLDQLSESKKKEVEKRNEVRRSLQNAFYTLSCAYLPMPALKKDSKLDLEGEKLLQQLDKIDKKELIDNFNAKLDEVRERIQQAMRPKKLDDQYLDGPKYAEYVRQIVHAINKEQTFCLQDVMLNIVRAEADELLVDLKAKYAKRIDSIVNGSSSSSKPKTVNEFEDQEKAIYEESIAAIKAKLSYKEQILKDCLGKFDTFRNTTRDEQLKKLHEKIKGWDKKALNELWTSKMKGKCSQASPQYSSVPEFDQELAQLKADWEKAVILKNRAEDLWREFGQEINVDAVKRDIQNEINKKAEREKQDKERQERERERLERESSRPPRFDTLEQMFRDPWLREPSSPSCNNSSCPPCQASYGGSSASSGVQVPRCKDGSRDMRYKANWGFDKYN